MAPVIVPNPNKAPIHVVAGIRIKIEAINSTAPLPILPHGSAPSLVKKYIESSAQLNMKNKDCKKINTQGVGGKSEVYLLKSKTKVRLGEYKNNISVGFLSSDFIPPPHGKTGFF